jgi:hypothetical protein
MLSVVECKNMVPVLRSEGSAESQMIAVVSLSYIF